MHGLLDQRRGRRAESPLELPPPYLGRRVGIVAQPAEHLEEVPVALELPVVVAIRGREQLERRQVVRLVLHLGGHRLVDLEAAAGYRSACSRANRRTYSGSPQSSTRDVPPFHNCQCIWYRFG